MISISKLMDHEFTTDCTSCRARRFARYGLVDNFGEWESELGVPRHSLALHIAGIFLFWLIEEGATRTEVQDAVTDLLSHCEMEKLNGWPLGGPPPPPNAGVRDH